jgi:dihydroxy-acid dehydratase
LIALAGRIGVDLTLDDFDHMGSDMPLLLNLMPSGKYLGGTLALVKTGDIIELNVEKRSLTLLVTEEELKKRRGTWTPSKPAANRGYVSMFIKHVEQADQGCDFDFLKGGSGSVVLRDLH